MKSKFYLSLLITMIFVSSKTMAQTVGLNIFQPNFTTQQAGWTTNGNASFGNINSSTAIILTPSTGTQIGTAFWKQKVSLSNNASFSTFFTFQIDQNISRADGITFILQQQSASATASTGEGLGYGGFTGANMAIEFDTYQNGYDPDNNHIALDLNGSVNHSTNGGLVKSIRTSTLDLADANLKYVWIDYNGSNHLLEVRISYSSTRPTNATLSTTNYNLSSIFTNPSVYMGFGAATGGAMERHSITSFYAINQYQPINPSATTYAQDAMGIAMSTSTTTLNANGSKQPVTITLTDAGGAALANQPVTLSITSGNGTLSTLSGTTNSSGQLVANLSSTATGSVTVQSVAGYGGLSASKTFNVISTLPILVSNFTAGIQGSEVVLNWNIESVLGGKNIDILRSADGVHFETIGSIEVNGQESLLGAASFQDASPLPGLSYYKLALNNLDAVSTYTQVAMVDFSTEAASPKILGNPVVNALKLVGLGKSTGTAIVYNISGRMMAQSRFAEGSSAVDISCNNLPAGEYFVQISQNNMSHTMKFIKL
ncbi:MAG: Ig-like domain-containing protein [Bacteroidetes bacterium]|nr:Ig-like domain-containing protein [Bacteroidota bacterium]